MANEMAPRIFDLDLQFLMDAFLSIIAIFVLFLFMSNLLFNPVRAYLKKRQDRIKDEIEAAAEKTQNAEKLKNEYEEKLGKIEEISEEILQEARKRALQNENKIIHEAKEESTRIMAHALVEVELEKKKVADEVKTQMVSIATLMARKFVAANIDISMQNELVEEALKEIGDDTWQN